MKSIQNASDVLYKRLHSFEFLRGLDDATLMHLAESSTWKVFAPNAVVFWEGDVESNVPWALKTYPTM